MPRLSRTPERGPWIGRTLSAWLLGVAALCSSYLCEAQDTVRMDEIVRHHFDKMAFMGSVLVARDGDVLFDKSYGLASLEWQLPHTSATRFQIGSITKQFTAAAVLLLEERGAISLDDPIRKYLPGAPRAWRGITIFHLLAHRSGIPDLLDLPDYASFKRSPATVEQVVAFFRDVPLRFRPGERMSYSNSGYVLLSYLIEQLSGESLERFLASEIFAPLRMRDSGLGSHAAVVLSLADGYARSGDDFVTADFIDMQVLHGAGAMYSTTGDLLKWTQALFGGDLLTTESLQRMTMPQEGDYALGVEVRNAHGRRVIEHGGGVQGFNAHLAYYPDDQVTVAVLGNVNGLAPEQIAWQLGAVVFGKTVLLPDERVAIDVAPGSLRRFTGTYRSSPTASLIVTLSEGQLRIRLDDRRPVLLYPESDIRFFARDIDAQVEFERDARGAVTALVLHRVNRHRRAPRTGGP